MAAPIDLDPEFSDPTSADLALPHGSSPTKRTRHAAPLENAEMVHLIQQTINSSLDGHLGRIENSLTTIAQNQTQHASRLTNLETVTRGQGHTLKEMQQSHSQRMDNLQAEIVQLQQAGLTSARGSPDTSPSSFRAAGPVDNPSSFDLVVGGWKEGLSRETIYSHINPLLNEAGVMADILEFKLFGKRPTIGKLAPHFPSNLTIQERRAKQVLLRDKVRSIFRDKDFWCTLDKPPKMRLISKAVGKLSGFLQKHFKMSPSDLVVGSWSLAKCFVGEHLLTGLAGSPGSKPPSDPTHLRWLVQDDATGNCVWADLVAISTALSINQDDLVKAWDLHFGSANPGGARRQ
eukprot:Skav201984  [mRNA]  locus=scaffold2976:96065:97105:+ [translate_table: standard]